MKPDDLPKDKVDLVETNNEVPAPGPDETSILDGKVRLGEKLGEGGMGKVFKAEHLLLKKTVAVKLMSGHCTDQSALQRFLREGQITFGLTDEHIVPTFDAGVTTDGQLYAIMDYVDGQPLSRILNSRKLSFEEVLEVSIQISKGLRAAHAKGIVHRDIKPSNILVSEDGDSLKIRIADFGIARDILSENRTLTKTGEIMGSPAYMSPEQIAGQKVDARGDLYSLGCVIFELLTGRPPFNDPLPLTMVHKHATARPPRLNSVSERKYPPEIQQILDSLLEKKPERRYQNAQDLIADLEALKSGNQPLIKNWRKHRTRLIASMIGAVVGAVVAVAMILIFSLNAVNVNSQPENPSDPQDCYDFAMSQWRAGNFQQSEKWFKKSTEIAPQYAEAWWGLGAAYQRQNQSQLCAESLEKALALNPSLWQCWRDLGLTHIELGQFEAAEKDLRKAVRNIPEDPQVWLSLAIALERQNKTAEAIDAYKRCLALTPDRRDASDRLADLKKRTRRDQ